MAGAGWNRKSKLFIVENFVPLQILGSEADVIGPNSPEQLHQQLENVCWVAKQWRRTGKVPGQQVQPPRRKKFALRTWLGSSSNSLKSSLHVAAKTTYAPWSVQGKVTVISMEICQGDE